MVKVMNARPYGHMWSIVALVSLAVFAALMGCAFRLPIRLEEVRIHEEVLKEDRSQLPRLTLTLHPDGLGWQISVIQQVAQTLVVNAEEYWRYRIYELSGKAPEDPGYYDDLCAFIMLTTPLFALFDVNDPPYWAKWDRMADGCKRGAEGNRALISLHDKARIRKYVDHSAVAVTDGHLALSWKTGEREPIQVLVPLQANSKEHGITVRLRWLAEAMRRKGHDPRLAHLGQVELQLVQRGRTIVEKELPVTADDLVASLKDDRAVSVPVDHWPRSLIVAIQRSAELLTTPDRGYLLNRAAHTLAASTRDHLLNRAAHVLSQLSIPIVVRGPEWDELREEQARSHQPAFAETPVRDPARTTGATVLLHLETSLPYSQSRILTLSLVHIGTGEILARITAGGHDSQWPFIVDTAMMQLERTLEHVMDRSRPTFTNGPSPAR